MGIDFDRQQTFYKWSARRARTRSTFPEFAETIVEAATLPEWRPALRRSIAYDLAIMDTPPSVEDHLPAIEALGEAADLILIPAVCTQDDVESVGPWAKALSAKGLHCAVVLNRANRRTTSYARIRGIFVKSGRVCPVELPQLEDIHVPSSKGLTLLDTNKSRGIEPFQEIWAYVRQELKI
jgi:chromosome partitioning protein